MSAAREALRIVPYEARHAAAFRELNLAWIEEHFAVEEPDRQQLLDPVATILAPGGAILIAAPALHLYRELGFVEAPIPSQPYTRVDIAMVLPLA